MPRSHSQRAGYVLVLTLGLLALAAISLAGLARYSIGLAASANTAAEELQHRWGLLSARHFFSERAASILDAQVPPDEWSTPPWPKPADLTVAFPLGGQQFSVLMADEDAKVNLNMIFARKPERVGPIIRHLNQGPGASIVRLAPQKSEARAFGSWGQVFDLANLPEERQAATEIMAATRQITCWGNRRLNLRRASDEALREVASLALPTKEAGELVELRRQWGGGEVNQLLAQLDLRRPQLLAASRLFANQSQNYSLWIEIDNGQRKWSYQYVDDDGPVCFAW